MRRWIVSVLLGLLVIGAGGCGSGGGSSDTNKKGQQGSEGGPTSPPASPGPGDLPPASTVCKWMEQHSKTSHLVLLDLRDNEGDQKSEIDANVTGDCGPGKRYARIALKVYVKKEKVGSSTHVEVMEYALKVRDDESSLETIRRNGQYAFRFGDQTLYESYTAYFDRELELNGVKIQIEGDVLTVALQGAGLWTTRRSGSFVNSGSPYTKDEQVDLNFKMKLQLDPKRGTWKIVDDAAREVYTRYKRLPWDWTW